MQRHYQQELGIFQVWTGWLTQGDLVPFITVLWPHNASDDAERLVQVSHLSLCHIPTAASLWGSR